VNVGTRRTVAYVVARLINGRSSSSVYDFARQSDTPMSVTISDAAVRVYDHGRQAHLSGSRHGDTYKLYDHVQKAQVSLELKGNRFSGYDSGARSAFSGSVSAAGIVWLYDDDDGGHFSFSV
jgi:hypothetical protein